MKNQIFYSSISLLSIAVIALIIWIRFLIRFLKSHRIWWDKTLNQVSSYDLVVENVNSESPKNCKLFGGSMYVLSPNYSSDIEIIVHPNLKEVNYLSILYESMHKINICKYIEIKFDKDTPIKNVTPVITYIKNYCNGESYSIPIITQNQVDPYESYDRDINSIKIPFEQEISGNTYFHFVIPPKTKYQISFHLKQRSKQKLGLLTAIKYIFSKN